MPQRETPSSDFIVPGSFVIEPYQTYSIIFFFQAEDGIRDRNVTGVQTCALSDLAVPFRAQRLDRALRAKIEIVGPQAHHRASQRVEGVAEQQELAGRVDVRALAALRVPRVTDLHAVHRGQDVVVARRADD